VTAVDTSVIIAAFASWHESHALCSARARPGPSLIAHCALETYSVLTRLPVPHRAPADLAAQFPAARFPGEALALPGGVQAELPMRLASAGITGGAVYDALLGATAVHHGATLVTLDVRAMETYRRVGVEVEALR
jgi:predicted nucleic acid-binding protein